MNNIVYIKDYKDRKWTLDDWTELLPDFSLMGTTLKVTIKSISYEEVERPEAAEDDPQKVTYDFEIIGEAPVWSLNPLPVCISDRVYRAEKRDEMLEKIKPGMKLKVYGLISADRLDLGQLELMAPEYKLT